MAALVEGQPLLPILSLYNFCEAWRMLPYPLHEMPNQLMDAFILIYNAREDKKRAIAEANQAKAEIGSDATFPLR